ncbi:MAG: hypothetical protein ACLFQ9_07585 [Desulfobacterales bacterium]
MIIIDFEASSLRKNSHPIEVAWGSHPDRIESYLLNPDFMEGWTDWNPKSFEYHGISKEELRSSGHDPRKIAARMIEALSGREVYSDEPHYDIRWKNRLLSDSGHDPSLVRILDLKTWLKRHMQNTSCAKTLNDMICTFECSITNRHRAAADVFWMLEFVAHVKHNTGST